MEACAARDGPGVVYALGKPIKPQEKTRILFAETPTGVSTKSVLVFSCGLIGFPNAYTTPEPSEVAQTSIQFTEQPRKSLYRQDMPESLHGPDRQTLRKCPVGAIKSLRIEKINF